MAKLLHMRMSIAQMLKHSNIELERVLRDDAGNVVPAETTRHLLTGSLERGTVFLPMDESCDNFDGARCCMGHELEPAKAVASA